MAGQSVEQTLKEITRVHQRNPGDQVFAREVRAILYRMGADSIKGGLLVVLGPSGKWEIRHDVTGLRVGAPVLGINEAYRQRDELLETGLDYTVGLEAMASDPHLDDARRVFARWSGLEES